MLQPWRSRVAVGKRSSRVTRGFSPPLSFPGGKHKKARHKVFVLVLLHPQFILVSQRNSSSWMGLCSWLHMQFTQFMENGIRVAIVSGVTV